MTLSSPVFRAVATCVVPEASRLDAAQWDEMAAIVARAIAARPRAMQRQLTLFLILLEWFPLVRDGVRILVLEKGPRFADQEFTGRELEMADALYQDGGAFLTRDGTMTLAFASAYGGSTVVYTGTSLTAPQRVIRAWGVPGLEHADLTRRSAKYAEQNNVHELDDSLINDNNRLFVEGGRKAGYLVEQFPVNVKGCRGSSLCNLGCPNQAKQGTNRVQLPRAERAGVEVVTRAEVLRIDPDRTLAVRVSEKAAGAKGRPSEWAPGDYRVRAGVVVCAGGVIGDRKSTRLNSSHVSISYA